MVDKIICECVERYPIKINSYLLFEEIKSYFENQVNCGIYEDIPVDAPFYSGYSELSKKDIKWFATKWYKCKICGCLWEFNYPDFPAQGFVRKFEDGQYHPE